MWPLLLLILQSAAGAAASSFSPPSWDLRPLSLEVEEQQAQQPSSCSSCALARLREQHQEQQEVEEAVKRHLLAVLQLRSRPNVTRPVPRPALLNALRRLHLGQVGRDGSLHLLGEEEEQGDGEEPRGGGAGGAGDGETTEIITFAEAGESLTECSVSLAPSISLASMGTAGKLR